METFYDVLFEVSNEDRYEILLQLADKPMNVTQLSKVIGLSLTETSRHLSRVGEVSLTRRDVEGLYHLSPFGELVLYQISGLKFISRYRTYFDTHNVFKLSRDFIDRLGELSVCRLDTDIVRVFNHVEIMLKEAQEFIWLQSYQVILWSASILEEKIEEGVDFRFIYPQDIEPPSSYVSNPSKFQPERVLEQIECRILVTENEAQVSFPYIDGPVDYSSFISDDYLFQRWCCDLFQYNWSKAKAKILELE